MNVLLVSAHEDPRSFVAALHNTALGVLERAEHKVQISDLYSQGFNPIASHADFKTTSGAHVNYMFEQQRSTNTGTGFSPDIEAEMQKVRDAEILVFQFPLWWGSAPAVLKGWFDRVLAMGFAWNADARFDKGLLRGKRALIVTTVGDPESFYSVDGMHRASVEQHLYSLTHNTLAFCGLDVLESFIVHNTTAASKEDLETSVERYRTMLQSINQAPLLYKH
jgi:NAD(P)H dehydrogenase (quinone)